MRSLSSIRFHLANYSQLQHALESPRRPDKTQVVGLCPEFPVHPSSCGAGDADASGPRTPASLLM